ncbi:ABC transporter permease [Allopusillimonas ginsengisoli]|uniref:ABC transporter permease n=1 Tax=Allopusillimonas ginsengisoli TaxID=453575 RepID=UPI0010C1EF06|nr:ABC transporter permease subunit [Allopusillimonas ginsengisoli]
MIVPLIIVAPGMFFFYTRYNLVGSFAGTLTGFDQTLYRAGLSYGASPFRVFGDIVITLIRPGVISGALFVFVTVFDEIVLVLFHAGPEKGTIPRQMLAGLREQINPAILAIATLLMVVSILFLARLEALRRRSGRIRHSSEAPQN